MMLKIPLKPISINKCWQGRRFKTPEYSAWRNAAGLLLRQHQKIERIKPYYELHVKIHKKSLTNYDSSNMIKAIEDAMVDVGMIEDDRYIIRHFIEKEKAKDGEEFFEIQVLNVSL